MQKPKHQYKYPKMRAIYSRVCVRLYIFMSKYIFEYKYET